MFDVVVVGSANVDYLVRGPRLPQPGEALEGSEFQQAPGGKGANQAVAAARLGARVALVGRMGTDAPGDTLLSALAAEGVDISFLTRDASAQTGTALVMVGRTGEKQILAAPGANRHLEVADIHRAAEALAATRVLLAQLKIPLESVIEAIRIARSHGARVVIDPAPAIPLPNEFLRLVDVLRPNSSEASVLTGIEVVDRASAREAGKQLIDRGAGAVAMQAGEEGNLLLWRGGERFLPKIPVRSVDATGAGDAFAAALAVRLAEGASLPDAACFGNAAAALATTSLGAQAGLPRRAAVLQLLQRIGALP